MYPSINNLAFTNTTNSLYNNNNSQSPNRNSPSYHTIHSSCIFHENNTSLQHFHDIPHKHDAPIVARNQSAKHNTTNTRMNVHQTPIDVLVEESPDDFFYNNSKKITRERSCRKDRHRKIVTVHGPRYPRMRLSLDVAKKFFGLQDMLGFDKASKTVQWLLNKSDTAIKQLITSSTRARNVSSSNTTSISSTSISSECEVLSGNIEDSPLSIPREVTAMEKAKQEAVRENKAVITRECRNSRAFHSLMKETRERARARARERTVEKRIRLGNGNYYNTRATNVPYVDRMDENINGHSRSWSPQAEDEEESSNRIQIVKNNHPFFQADHQEPASRTTLMQHKQFFVDGDHYLFNMPRNWSQSTSPFFNYHQNDAI